MAVYVAELMASPDGRMKIGYSKDVRRRMKGLLAQFPKGLRLLAVNEAAGRGAEATLHAFCEEYSLGEEWFKPNQWIDGFVAHFGLAVPEEFTPKEQTFRFSKARNREDAEIARKLMVNVTKLIPEHKSAQAWLHFLHSELAPLYVRGLAS